MDINTEDAMRGMYLCFGVNTGDYGIEIHYVTEIIEVQEITPVPNTHHYVKGIINLRGTIVPVIDMRARFNDGEIEFTARTCIIVLTMSGVDIGLIVDEVQEVMTIGDNEIHEPPTTSGADDAAKFIRAIGYPKRGTGDGKGEIKQLLDINKIFEMDDMLS